MVIITNKRGEKQKMNINKKLEFPICKDCGNRHYRKAGKPCEYKGTKNR
jgi:hypothetical protein